jgi:hypothetical protein
MPKHSSVKPTFKLQIIEKYVTIINEFLVLFSQSNLINESPNVLVIGINTLHRVFEYVLIKTQSLEKTVYYAQKANYYFLEYMDQITQSNTFIDSLNHIDATVFVYKKTIFDLYDGENNTFNTMTNIMTLNDELLHLDNLNWTSLFSNILKSVQLLLFIENDFVTHMNRTELFQTYLLKWLSQPNLDVTNSFLEIIQQKILTNRDFMTFKQVINEFLSRPIQPKLKTKWTTDLDKNEHYLKKIYNDDTIFYELFNSNMKDFVNWLYV